MGLWLVTAVPSHAAESPYRSVGYVEEWAQYRTGDCQFSFDSINPNLYTHLMYAFAEIDASNGNYTVTAMSDGNNTAQAAASYARFQSLKQLNPNLKTLLSIGGASFSTGQATKWIYSAMVSSAQTRQAFAANAVQYARTYGFDGLDIDWEYPACASNGGWPSDTNNFTALLSDLRNAITSDATVSGKPALLLTFAAPATSNDYAGIQLGAASQYVDWVNLMAYDYHGAWETQTGALAPLMMDTTSGSTLNDSDTVQAYLSAGVPANKIVLGLAAYGRTFGQVAQSRMNTESKGGGDAGYCTAQSGILGYNEIVDAEQSNRFEENWDPISMTPFAFDRQAGNWVSYENTLSFEMKLLYVQQMRLGGAMLWSVDTDDGAHGFPLSKIMYQTLQSH